MKIKILNKIFLFCMIFALVCTAACPVLYNIIGSTVAEDGMLDEPFFLVPMGYMFLFIAVICLVLYLVTRAKIRKLKENN